MGEFLPAAQRYGLMERIDRWVIGRVCEWLQWREASARGLPELVMINLSGSSLSDAEKAKILSRFFKTGKGQYGEGDVFLGVMVPGQRRVVKKYADLPLGDIQRLLSSGIHENRLVALLILVGRYRRSGPEGKAENAEFYLKNTGRINNWDLVDLSAPNIMGAYLLDKSRKPLHVFA